MMTLAEKKDRIKALEDELDLVTRTREQLAHKIIYNSMSEGLDLPYATLERPDVGEKIDLPVDRGRVISHRVNDDKAGVVAYITNWYEYGVLRKHYHSDCIEVIIPISGKFTIVTDDYQRTIEPGQSCSFSINETHIVSCDTERGICKVLFSKHPILDR